MSAALSVVPGFRLSRLRKRSTVFIFTAGLGAAVRTQPFPPGPPAWATTRCHLAVHPFWMVMLNPRRRYGVRSWQPRRRATRRQPEDADRENGENADDQHHARANGEDLNPQPGSRREGRSQPEKPDRDKERHPRRGLRDGSVALGDEDVHVENSRDQSEHAPAHSSSRDEPHGDAGEHHAARLRSKRVTSRERRNTGTARRRR